MIFYWRLQMTAKEILKQYRFKINKVDEALEEYERYKTRAEKMTAILSDVPSRSNKTSDKVGDNATIMADLSKEYEKRWIEAEQERLKIIDSINKVDEPYRTILEMRYIQNQKLEDIAYKIGYSPIHIVRLHGIALLKYSEKVDM